MNRKVLIVLVLSVFVVGMICVFAAEPVEAKSVAKVKKVKNHYKAKFKYMGKTYNAKLKKNREVSDYYGEKVYDSTKKKGGSYFRLYYTTNPDDWGSYGWNFCKLRSSSGDSHKYYKVKWV